MRVAACGRVESGMIGRRLDLVGAEDGREFFHFLSRQAIDDTALPRVLLDKTYDLLVYLLRFRAHFVIEVRPVERAFKLQRVGDAQALLDVGAHLVGSRGGESDDRGLAYALYRGADIAVFRAEVMSPLRDTMRLVDRVKRYFDRFEEIHVVVLIQRLGSHIEQFRLPLHDIGLDLVDSRLIERRVEVVSHPLLFAHAIDHIYLVFHECYQRRDHDGCALHDERGQLVAQRLATAGRHEHKGIVASKHILDDGLLVAFELIEAEILLQFLG